MTNEGKEEEKNDGRKGGGCRTVEGGGKEGNSDGRRWRVGGASYEIDAEEGGSYEAGLQGSLEMVTMPWAGTGDGMAGISVDWRRYLQGG